MMANTYAYLIGGQADQIKRVLLHPVHTVRWAELPSCMEDRRPLEGVASDAWCHIHEYHCVYRRGDTGVYFHESLMK